MNSFSQADSANSKTGRRPHPWFPIWQTNTNRLHEFTRPRYAHARRRSMISVQLPRTPLHHLAWVTPIQSRFQKTTGGRPGDGQSRLELESPAGSGAISAAFLPADGTSYTHRIELCAQDSDAAWEPSWSIWAFAFSWPVLKAGGGEGLFGITFEINITLRE